MFDLNTDQVRAHVKFFTAVKTITPRWLGGGGTCDSAFFIPTMG